MRSDETGLAEEDVARVVVPEGYAWLRERLLRRICLPKAMTRFAYFRAVTLWNKRRRPWIASRISRNMWSRCSSVPVAALGSSKLQ